MRLTLNVSGAVLAGKSSSVVSLTRPGRNGSLVDNPSLSSSLVTAGSEPPLLAAAPQEQQPRSNLFSQQPPQPRRVTGVVTDTLLEVYVHGLGFC